MENKETLFLESASGFMMPFESNDDASSVLTLGYGEQTHPYTGEKFNHSGIDFAVKEKPLFAIATGIVSGIGNDAVHDNYVNVRYGNYDVKYGHIKESYVNYGMAVQAGEQIAASGDFLHIGVKCKGVEMDPMEFLAMIYGNVLQLTAMGMKTRPVIENLGVNVKTRYDKDMDDISEMMLRYLPSFFNDLMQGTYACSSRFEQSLRNIFAQVASKNYFFERVPYIGNPLGLSSRAEPLISKVQNLLIEEFLQYSALKKNAFIPSWGKKKKKNYLSRLLPTGL